MCEESSPRPGAENLHDNQVHLQSLLLAAAWLTSMFSCMIMLLNWAFNNVFPGGKITSDNEHIFTKLSGLAWNLFWNISFILYHRVLFAFFSRPPENFSKWKRIQKNSDFKIKKIVTIKKNINMFFSLRLSLSRLHQIQLWICSGFWFLWDSSSYQCPPAYKIHRSFAL